MIVTLTPNPSVDRTVEVDSLERGSVVRARSGRVDPGGKGINVARALVAHGHAVTAVLPCGGSEGKQLTGLLDAARIDVVGVPIAGSIRANITVVEPDGTVTKLNEPGPHLSPDEAASLNEATVLTARAAQWLVACGSLPLGVADDFYARVIEQLSPTAIKIAIDTSGSALLKSLPAAPDVIKPNIEELSDAAGIPVRTLGDALTAALKLREQGSFTVIASLGADGALYVDDSVVRHAEVSVDDPRSSVGAGDALLAGFLAHGGHGVEAFRRGVAWAAAAVSLPGSQMPAPADVDLSKVRLYERVDVARSLDVSVPVVDRAVHETKRADTDRTLQQP
ncbi:MAG: 1-phosphofructokinase [Actinomycetota bacterium]